MRKIGRYEIESEIGRGSMGVVYLAHDPHVRRRVAVKTFQLPQGLTPIQEREYNERFLREAQAAGALSHPAIVTIYDADADAEHKLPYIAMEYVEGSSLRQLLASKGQLDPAQVFAMGEILAEALKVAHDAGIVHRDIKPANILVRSRDGAVKIADFGVARLSTSELTGIGDIFGSPAYMSPEQFRGAPVDARSDLFSLATILYQALCGERPFPGEEVSSIAYAVAHSVPLPPSNLRSGLPPDLDQFFERALAKDPADRFPDGAAFKRALSDLRQGRSTPGAGAPWGKAAETPLSASVPAAPKRKMPVFRIGGRSVSALEGAFAVVMLLLALLPGLWVLRGVTSRTSSSTSRAAGSAAAVPEDPAHVVHAGDPLGPTPPGGAGGSGKSALGADPRAAGAKPYSDGWVAPVGPSVRHEERVVRSRDEIRKEAAENGWALVPDPSAPPSSRTGVSSPRRDVPLPSGRTASSGTGATVNPQNSSARTAAASTKPSFEDLSRSRGTNVASQTGTKGRGQETSGTAAPVVGGVAEGMSDLLRDVARLEAPVKRTVEDPEANGVLEVDVKSAIKSGVLRLLVDGKEVYSRVLSSQSAEAGAEPPRKMWFKRRQERFEARLEVSPGTHEIVAIVVPDGMTPGYRETTVVDVKPSEPFKLHLVAGRALGSPLTLDKD